MPRFTNSARVNEIAANVQRVYVNRYGSWTLDPHILGRPIVRGLGASGSSATFEIPRAKWDECNDIYAGAEVAVYASENSSTVVNAQAWFHGWIQAESAKLSADNNSYGVTAISIVQLLDAVPVGLKEWTVKDWDGTTLRERKRKGLGARYPRLGPIRNGKREPLWNPKEVLYDVFAGLPTYWASVIELGDTTVLRDPPFKTKGILEWDFSSVGVLEAIETLVDCWGDVTFVERFNGMSLPRVYLDFFEIQEKRTGTKTISIPVLCNDIGTNDFNVQEIDRSDEHHDVRDRVILSGKPITCVITCASNDSDSNAQLRKGWDVVNVTKTLYAYENGAKVSLSSTKTNEEWVLDDPDTADPNSENFIPQCEFCFKRWLLPQCLIAPHVTILEDLQMAALQADPYDDSPKYLKRQCFKTAATMTQRKVDWTAPTQLQSAGYLTSTAGYECDYVYGDTDASTTTGWGYYSPFGWRILPTSRVDEAGEIVKDDLGGGDLVYPWQAIRAFDVGADGVLMLDKPALITLYKTRCGSKDVCIRSGAEVALTIAVAHEERITYDTGQPAYRPGSLGTIGNDGLMLAATKDQWEYTQLTNLGTGPRLGDSGATIDLGFYTPGGTSVSFTHTVYENIYDPDADDETVARIQGNERAIIQHARAQSIIRDDWSVMRDLANRLLELKSKVRRAFMVTIPMATQAYDPGDSVVFSGADIPYDEYAITNITIDFSDDFHTELTVDNSRPEGSIHMEW
jgi:hypothetical protein